MHLKDDSVFMQRCAQRESDLRLCPSRIQRRKEVSLYERADRPLELPRGGPERSGAQVCLAFYAKSHRNQGMHRRLIIESRRDTSEKDVERW